MKRIIADFNARPTDEFAFADYGVRLDAEEQRRRYLIKSLLRAPAWNSRPTRLDSEPKSKTIFRNSPNCPPLGLGVRDEQTLRLTPEGLSWSDVIGPWLYSRHVTARMEAFQLV